MPTEGHCEDWQIIEQMNAQMSRFMGIPFPEQLDDFTWAKKYRQFEWLLASNRLPIKIKDAE